MPETQTCRAVPCLVLSSCLASPCRGPLIFLFSSFVLSSCLKLCLALKKHHHNGNKMHYNLRGKEKITIFSKWEEWCILSKEQFRVWSREQNKYIFGFLRPSFGPSLSFCCCNLTQIWVPISLLCWCCLVLLLSYRVLLLTCLILLLKDYAKCLDDNDFKVRLPIFMRSCLVLLRLVVFNWVLPHISSL